MMIMLRDGARNAPTYEKQLCYGIKVIAMN